MNRRKFLKFLGAAPIVAVAGAALLPKTNFIFASGDPDPLLLSSRANKFLAFDAEGNPCYLDGIMKPYWESHWRELAERIINPPIIIG